MSLTLSFRIFSLTPANDVLPPLHANESGVGMGNAYLPHLPPSIHADHASSRSSLSSPSRGPSLRGFQTHKNLQR